MTIPRPGRPIGSGLDDEAALDAVEALMAAEPDLSQRAAIVRISGDADADLRRLQRKLSFRAQARAGDARRLLAEPFEHGEVRRGRLWAWIVEVPVPEGITFAVAMATFVGQPVLEVVDVGTEMPFMQEERPSHPIVLAIRKLPRGYDWDDPSYRICCERLGVDPDRDRPARFETQIAAASAIFGESLGAPIVKGEVERIECGSEGTDVEGTHRPDVEYAWLKELRENEAEDARRRDREAHSQIVADGMAFDVTGTGTYDPQRLSGVHSRYHDVDEPKARQAAEEARRAFDAVDWSKASAFTDMRWLANPWEFDHHTSVHLLGTAHDSFSSWSGNPEFIAPPRKGDLVARRAALAAERNFMAIVLSEEEMANFEAGGDRTYWWTVKNWYTPRWTRLRARWTAPDLEMTARLVDAMVANACECYVSRASGETLDPKAALSCEMREPIASSRPRTFLRVVYDALAARWELGRFRLQASRGQCVPHVRDGRLELPWGDCFIGRADGRIIVRPGTHPLSCNDHLVRLSVDLIRGFDGRYIPLVASYGFDATDLCTGKPVPVAVLRSVLEVVADGCILLPAGEVERSVPLRRKIGWAAAGFAACLLAFGSLSGQGGASSRAVGSPLPPGAMPSIAVQPIAGDAAETSNPVAIRTVP